jgi:hypothetical protein
MQVHFDIIYSASKFYSSTFDSDALLSCIRFIYKRYYRSLSAANIDFDWRYYRDGKAWLGKATFKKKTVVWISVWDNFIKATFYFTEKTRPAVLGLDIAQEIKISFAQKKPVGKLIPLILDIRSKQAIQDFTILVNHKKNLR